MKKDVKRMKYRIVKEELKRFTYYGRILLIFCDIVWVKVLYKAFSDNLDVGLTVYVFVIFALLLYCTYYLFRTPYFCIPISRYYDKRILKQLVEKETFIVLKKGKIWESEHWIKIQHIFLPKSLICRIGGSVASNTIMTISTLDNKEYTLYHMGHLKRQQEEEMIGSTLPLVRLLNEKGYDGQKAILRLPSVTDKFLDEMLKNYLSNHSVEDLINTTDIMEMYVKEYDRIMSGGRKKKKMEKGT